MNRMEKLALLDELLHERDKLTRLWTEKRRGEMTLDDARECYAAQTKWDGLFRQFVATVIEETSASAAS
jgi:hypothetical protein